MNRHPKEFIENWVDDLADAFRSAERRYERALDRGAPRERALRSALATFLPKKYGIGSGHIVNSAPSWSRQSDVIIYNALEAPVFSVDDGFQGVVLPAESVYGTIEVKSSLDEETFSDAAQKIAGFKRLCNEVQSPRLSDRFGAVFAYRMAAGKLEDQEACVQKCIEIAQTYPEGERVDDLFVLGVGEADLSQSIYVSLVPQGSPTGPLGYYSLPRGRRNMKVFLMHLDSRLLRVRTGAPADLLGYLFDWTTELGPSDGGPDPRRLRGFGELPILDVVRKNIIPKVENGRCHMCGGQKFSTYDDVYCLVATKDYRFGRLGEPQVPVVVLECLDCHTLTLVSSNAHDVTAAG